jgi:hypothetical protein
LKAKIDWDSDPCEKTLGSESEGPGETLRSYGSPRRSFHQHALAGDADIIDSGIPNAKLNAMRDMIAFFIGNILC